MSLRVSVLLAVFMTFVPRVQADSITILPSKDNTLYLDPLGQTSNGSGQHLFAGPTASSQARRALLAFDVAGNVPAGSNITGATLTLHMSRTIGGEALLGLHRSLGDWGEGLSDALGFEGGGTAAQPGDATWLHNFYDTSFWATPGGDFQAIASADTLVDGDGFYSWTSSTLVSDVQSWLDMPSANLGWLLAGDESLVGTAKRFDSRENPDLTVRPSLAVEFVVPEPATLVLIGVGLAAAVVSFRTRPR